MTPTFRDIGHGAFGAVGFSYGGSDPTPAASAAASESDSDDSDDSEDDSDADDAPVAVDIEVAAAAFGVDNFAVMLRRAEREEEAIAQGKIPKRR